MYSYKLVLSYDGSHYHGWQKQVEQSLPTIQQALENSISKLIKRDDIYTIGSGRTDAGVHALGQVVRLDLPVELPAENLARAVNSFLPRDIKITHAEICESRFHPQKSAVSKEYRYYFTTNKDSSLFQDYFVTYVYHQLNFEKMDEACRIFVGEHDFTHYYCEGTPVKSHIREIYHCSIEQVRGHAPFSHDHYVLVISGSGFLKQMVRLIMGAIWEVGRGELSLEALAQSLKNPDLTKKRHLSALAPAKGLFLDHVCYK